MLPIPVLSRNPANLAVDSRSVDAWQKPHHADKPTVLWNYHRFVIAKAAYCGKPSCLVVPFHSVHWDNRFRIERLREGSKVSR